MVFPIVRFQSPTEICSHSDHHGARGDGESCGVSISYGDMQSFRPQQPAIAPSDYCRFNLLRRYAVIPTPDSRRQYEACSVSISYGDMQSFRQSCNRHCAALNTFQSPTEICSHSDIQIRLLWIWLIFVSISYGDMQSFRPELVYSSPLPFHQFQSPTEICSHSDCPLESEL